MRLRSTPEATIPIGAQHGVHVGSDTLARRPRRLRVGTAVVIVVGLIVVGVLVVRSRRVHTVRLNVSGAANGPDRWSVWPNSPLRPRFEHLMVAAGSGILMWGGNSDFENNELGDGAFLDGTTHKWRRLPDSPLFGAGFAIGAWTGTEVVVVNGQDGDVRVAAFDPVSFTWRALPDLPVDIAYSPRQILYVDGTIMVIDEGVGHGPVLWLDEAAETWRRGAPLPMHGGQVSDVVSMGDLAVASVYEETSSVLTCGRLHLFTYRPATDTWAELPSGPAATRLFPMVTWTGSELFVGGIETCENGQTGGSTYTADLLDPATGTWRAAADGPIALKPVPRWFGELWTGHSVALVQSDGSPLLYNPTTDSWHVGPTPLAPHQLLETPFVVVDGSIVIAEGLSWLTNPDCCVFSPGTYAYQPPDGF